MKLGNLYPIAAPTPLLFPIGTICVSRVSSLKCRYSPTELSSFPEASSRSRLMFAHRTGIASRMREMYGRACIRCRITDSIDAWAGLIDTQGRGVGVDTAVCRQECFVDETGVWSRAGGGDVKVSVQRRPVLECQRCVGCDIVCSCALRLHVFTRAFLTMATPTLARYCSAFFAMTGRKGGQYQ